MNIEKVYEEAFKSFGTDRILFRGFLLEKKVDGSVSFKDIRNPYYRDISSKDLKIFLELGFSVGATSLLMKSDQRKIDRYTRLIDNKARLLKDTVNPRKLKEHINTISRYDSEINYYKSQVSRWQEFIKHN